jgi:hypothetical protein
MLIEQKSHKEHLEMKELFDPRLIFEQSIDLGILSPNS